jgi:aryl-alcohol dehydrogenase-like predicted oxidoreductase
MDNHDIHQKFFDLNNAKYNWDENESERDLDFMTPTAKQLNIPSIPFSPIESSESLLSNHYDSEKAGEHRTFEQLKKKEK